MNTKDRESIYQKHRIFDMTWVEMKEWLEKTDVVLVPLGSVEQHGPHLPIGIDSYAGYYVCMEAAVKADVPVAPLMPYGYSPFHMRPNEPGTITLRDETLFNVLYDIGRSLVYHGFKKIIYSTGHTSNAPTIDRVLRAIRYETGALAIGYAADTEVFSKLCDDIIEGKDQLPGWHAGEIETSAGLLICPELVRLERAKAEFPTTPSWLPEGSVKDSGSGFEIKYKNYPVRIALDQFEYGKSGVMGNPLLGSREKGEKIYERMTDLFAEFIKGLKDVPVEIKKRDFPERY
ncbi:creatininase family protein [Desulfitibacter alkalitolerans]|uniref:creatininase family protein n=1 Tax=Desulfitibacter alkalitolerans TaxID=264641 RepID=UPI000489C50D|nr:creatininase family protein [Desulfitibacter alkalitolerans]